MYLAMWLMVLGALVGCQAWSSDVGEPSLGHWSNRDLPGSRNINWWELSQRYPSQWWNPAPLNDQQTPVLDTQCQTTSRTGIQPHPLKDSLPKIISSQTPQNTPHDMVLPTRKTRSSLIHQDTGTSLCHQETYRTHWTNITTGGRHQKQWDYKPASCEKETPNTVS